MTQAHLPLAQQGNVQPPLQPPQPSGLSSGHDALRDAACAYFSEMYEKPTIKLGESIDPNLRWKPTIQFTMNGHLTVIAEVSDTLYPAIFNMRQMDILDLEMPISVYCVCPEEVFLDAGQQSEVKRLQEHGYGLLTVDAAGNVQRRVKGIPLTQLIRDKEFRREIGGLPANIRQMIVEAYERYNNSPPAGTAAISEVLEGMVLKAGREASAKGWIAANQVKAGQPSQTLQAMIGAPQCGGIAAALGGAQHYISVYRNTSHHFPKNKKQAYVKYRDCKHAFLDGIKKIQTLRASLRGIKFSGGLPTLA